MSGRRPTVAVVPLAIASVVLLALPSSWTQGPRLTAMAGLAPVRATASSLGNLAAGLNPLSGTPSRDDLLRRLELSESKCAEYLAKISKLEDQVESLKGARGKIRDPKLTLLPATVIVPTDSSSWRKSLVIAKGSRHGVAVGMPVLWNNHLVGRISAVAPWTSRVILLTDPEMKISAAAAPKLADKTQMGPRDLGVLEGTGESSAWIKWYAGDAVVEDGETVVTTADPFAGIPEGLLLGRIAGASRVAGQPRVQVKPFVNLRALDSVLVLLKQEDP